MGKTRIAQMFRTVSGREFMIGIALVVFGAAVAGILGTVDGVVQSPWNPFERSISPSDTTASALEQLQNAFATEVQAREELAAQIAELDAKISRLQLSIDETVEGSLAENELPLESPDSEELAEVGAESASGAGVEASQFDDEVLLSLGTHPRDVDRLHDRWVSHLLETASLSNQALREGWFDQQRHRAELIGSELALRQELQDADYDLYLYALGKPNRLKAGEVLAGSAASEAGLRRGDTILSYDDARVFRPGELLVASSAGELGRSIPMEILRDGRRETLYIRRGPLGTLLEHSRAEPLRK
jgi:hypothetical protein